LILLLLLRHIIHIAMAIVSATSLIAVALAATIINNAIATGQCARLMTESQ
jgi:hypothetical protein